MIGDLGSNQTHTEIDTIVKEFEETEFNTSRNCDI